MRLSGTNCWPAPGMSSGSGRGCVTTTSVGTGRGTPTASAGRRPPAAAGGESLPLIAGVRGVAEACAALMRARRYRPPLSAPQIEAVLRRFAGSQWDPQVVVAFLACRGDVFPPIYQKGIGESAYHALSDVVTAEVERSTLFHPALDDHALQAGRQ